jgi:hypothetical protein
MVDEPIRPHVRQLRQRNRSAKSLEEAMDPHSLGETRLVPHRAAGSTRSARRADLALERSPRNFEDWLPLFQPIHGKVEQGNGASFGWIHDA